MSEKVVEDCELIGKAREAVIRILRIRAREMRLSAERCREFGDIVGATLYGYQGELCGRLVDVVETVKV